MKKTRSSEDEFILLKSLILFIFVHYYTIGFSPIFFSLSLSLYIYIYIHIY